MDIKELSEALSKKLTYYRLQSKSVQISKKEFGETVFLQKDEKSYINPKYLSLVNYFEIVGLEEFVRENNISQDELDEILSSKKANFVFLRELSSSVEDMADLLKKQGAFSVAIVYVNGMLYPKRERSI